MTTKTHIFCKYSMSTYSNIYIYILPLIYFFPHFTDFSSRNCLGWDLQEYA